MYETYKEVLKVVNDFMQHPKICEFLTVKQIDNHAPDRKNILKFGMILKEMDQYLKEQNAIEQKIRGKLLTLIKADKSFTKFGNFIQIVNHAYTIEYSQALLDELSFVTEVCSDDLLSTTDIIYETLKRARGSLMNDHVRFLLSHEIRHPITTKLNQLCQPSHLSYMLLHNEKIIFILIAVCNQEQIPIPDVIDCLHLTGDQMRLRIDEQLSDVVLNIAQVKKVAEELGYNNTQLAQQGLLELKLQYYKSYLEVQEQDLIDSALSVLVLNRIEVNQSQIKKLITATSKITWQPQITRLNNLFNQLLENSLQMTERRQATKNQKNNINLVLYQVLDKMTREKQPFPQIINFIRMTNHGVLKLDITEPMIRRNYHYIAKTLTDLFHVTSQTQLNNYCRTQIVDPNIQINELGILQKMLALIYQERSKHIMELKVIFDSPEIKKTIMVLNLQREKYGTIIEWIQKLQQYSLKKEIIELDSDEEEGQNKLVKK